MKSTQTFVTKLTRLAHGLPEGIGLLVVNGCPLFAVTGPNTHETVGYVVYLQKQGTTPVRPPLSSVAGKDEEIMELGDGWLLMRVIFSLEEMQNPFRCMARVHQAIPRLEKFTPKAKEEPTCIVSSAS